MKLKFNLAIILFILLYSVDAFAETTIKAEVDKMNLAAGDTLTYKVTIASTENNLPRPQFPKFKGFTIVSQAQSSTLSFAKNKINTALVYTFVLAPTEAGKFKIEPALIKIKGKIYSTDAFEIEATKPSLPQESQPQSGEPQITL